MSNTIPVHFFGLAAKRPLCNSVYDLRAVSTGQALASEVNEMSVRTCCHDGLCGGPLHRSSHWNNRSVFRCLCLADRQRVYRIEVPQNLICQHLRENTASCRRSKFEQHHVQMMREVTRVYQLAHFLEVDMPPLRLTLMPPAVDVLPPPTTIRVIVSKIELSCMPPVLIVFKPAVRGVTP